MASPISEVVPSTVGNGFVDDHIHIYLQVAVVETVRLVRVDADAWRRAGTCA